MAYAPIQSSSVPPGAPVSAGSQSPSVTADQASDGYNKASLSFDSGSGCLRLTPMLSWNYFSLLDSSSYWYERYIGGAVGAVGTLPKGNAYIVQKFSVPNGGDSNVTGEPTPVTPVTGTKPIGDQYTHFQYFNKVSGIGQTRSFNISYVDQQSAGASNQSGNFFAATNTDNAWKEQLTTEFATLSNSDTVPNVLIRSNFDYFRCGEDPALLYDPTTKYSSQSSNLAAEYILTSNFDLPSNASFAITYHVYSTNQTQGQATDPVGQGYFRVYWASYCFQFNGTEASFCGDTSNSDKTQWVFQPIYGLKLTTQNRKTLITLIFEVVGNSIVISNAIDIGNKDERDKNPSWSYTDLENLDPTSFGISVPASSMTIGVRAMDIAFSYIPVVYPPRGQMIVTSTQTGYSINGLNVTGQVDTHEIMGGQTQIVTNVVDASVGSFGYTITISRGSQPDATPALFSVSIASQPSFTGISIAAFPTLNRVRRVNCGLGQESQSGSLTLDNRDGVLSTVGGVLPCQISVGWMGDPETGGPGLPAQQIFNGFITNQGTVKNPNSSSVDFSLVGLDLVLKDAIAVNLPIYDGYDSGEAVNDLLVRGGWQGNTNVQTGGYQLNVSANPPSPVWMFPLGKSIMDCIHEISVHAGYWAFVDCTGTFNYIPMSNAYGNQLGTYNEVPQLNGYNEWLSLSGMKQSQDVRNAVLVVGLQMLTDNIPIPISAVRTDAGGTVGNYLSPTLIPWLRWYVLQDPKINTAEAAAGIAEQLWQNNNRLRIGVSGMTWGSPIILPWSQFSINLITDNIGIPPGAKWRILNVNHSLNADDRSNYTCEIQAEFIDGRYSYSSFWE
jgi:hypothetical protein